MSINNQPGACKASLGATEGAAQPRYLAGEWSHLFGPGKRETRCRVLVAPTLGKLLAAQEWTGLKFEDVHGDRLLHLQESVIEVNEAHLTPDDFGLEPVDAVPEWLMSEESISELMRPHPVVLALGDNVGQPKLALAIDDYEIADPTISPCGRFNVDPRIAYGLTARQVRVLARLNVLLHQSVQAALDAGCLSIQQQVGIASGDAAGTHFSGGNALNDATRVLGEYLLEEIESGAAKVRALHLPDWHDSQNGSL